MLSALLGASFWDALNTPHRVAKAYSGRALLLLLLAKQEGANTRLIRAHIAPDSMRAFLRVLDAETSSPFGWSQTRTVQRARFPRQSARSADFDLIDRSRPNTKRSNKPAPLRRLSPTAPHHWTIYWEAIPKEGHEATGFFGRWARRVSSTSWLRAQFCPRTSDQRITKG